MSREDQDLETAGMLREHEAATKKLACWEHKGEKICGSFREVAEKVERIDMSPTAFDNVPTSDDAKEAVEQISRLRAQVASLRSRIKKVLPSVRFSDD